MSTNTIGNLVVQLGLNPADYMAGWKKAQAETSQHVNTFQTQFAALRNSLAGLGIGAAFVSAVKGTGEYAAEVDKLAKLSGTTNEEFQRQAYAAKSLGIGMEELASKYKDVQEKVGEFMRSGGGELKDFFETIAPKVGVTADQFARLSGPEALQLYVSSLQKAGVSQNEMITYMEAIADDSSLLLPLLQNNGKAMRELGDEAQRLGSVMDNEAIRSGKEFALNLTKLHELQGAITRQMAGPLVQSLADGSTYFLAVARDVGVARAALISYGAAAARVFGTDDLGKLESQAKIQQNLLKYTTSQIEIWDGYAKQGVSGAAEKLAVLRADFDRLVKQGAELSEKLKGEADASVAAKIPEALPAPGRGVGTGVAASTKDSFAEGKKYLEGLQKRLDTTGELTEAEKALAEVQSGRLGKLTTSTRESILTTAKEIDQRKQQAEDTKDRIEKGRAQALAEGDAVMERNKQYQESIAALIAASPTGKLEEQRKLMQDLADEYERGRFGIAGTTEAIQLYSETVNTYLGNVVKQTDDAAEMAKRLGDSYASAFSNAFTSGSSLSDLLKRLAFETVNIKFLTPAAQKAGDWLSAGVSSLFKSFDGGGYTGDGSRTGGMDGKGGYLAMLHPQETVLDHTKGQGMTLAGGGTSVTQHITIDARGADAGVENRIRAAMDQVRKEIVPTVVRAANSGGSTARALGRA